MRSRGSSGQWKRGRRPDDEVIIDRSAFNQSRFLQRAEMMNGTTIDREGGI